MATSASSVTHLPFQLPDFTRFSWVSESAKHVWSPRLEKIGRAWTQMEWLAVASGERPCALCWLSPELLPDTVAAWTAHRISAIRIASTPTDSASPDGPTNLICAAVGSEYSNVLLLRQAWEDRDHETVGRLLGYPTCCRNFFHELWVNQNLIDTTWGMAANTSTPKEAVTSIDPPTSDLANILWRWIGVRAVPHLPCRFDCLQSIQVGECFMSLGAASGFGEEVDWIRQILSWPVEWSVLHGIAEIKTPLLKISTRSDATASKYVVRWLGRSYPEEGATGTRFPYRPSASPAMTQLGAFRRGLDHPIQIAPMRSTRDHRENGFSSPEAMRRLHQPIVALAREVLSGTHGNVLDLGCGNAALLEKICESDTGLVPYGVDNNEIAIQHAREIWPALSHNFVAGDLFNAASWPNQDGYQLVLLMVGRLLEVQRPKAEQLIASLKAASSRVLVYIYPDWSQHSLDATVQQFGLQLRTGARNNAGLLAF